MVSTLDILQDGSFALRPSDEIDAVVLASNTAEDYTVPSGVSHIVFSGSADFYCRYTGTAAIPAADVTDGTAPELNPTVRYVKGVTTISFIAPAATVVTLMLYKS